MALEYKLPFTASEIENKLSTVDALVESDTAMEARLAEVENNTVNLEEKIKTCVNDYISEALGGDY